MGTIEQNSVKMIFEKNWSGLKNLDTENTLVLLSQTIPGADYFFSPVYDKQSVDIAREQAFQQRKKGSTIYMIDDDPDIVHWFSMNKQHEPFINAIERFLFPYIMFSDFSPADLTWEAD